MKALLTIPKGKPFLGHTCVYGEQLQQVGQALRMIIAVDMKLMMLCAALTMQMSVRMVWGLSLPQRSNQMFLQIMGRTWSVSTVKSNVPFEVHQKGQLDTYKVYITTLSWVYKALPSGKKLLETCFIISLIACASYKPKNPKPVTKRLEDEQLEKR